MCCDNCRIHTFEVADKESLGRLLEAFKRASHEAPALIGSAVHPWCMDSDLAAETSEGQLRNKEVGILLVSTDLAEGNGYSLSATVIIDCDIVFVVILTARLESVRLPYLTSLWSRNGLFGGGTLSTTC